MFRKKATVLHAKKYSKAVKIAIIAVAVIASSCLIAYGWQKYDEKKYPAGAERDYKLPNAFLDFVRMASDFVNREKDGEEPPSSQQSSSLSEESREDTHLVVGSKDNYNNEESSSAAESESEPEEPVKKGGPAPESEAASEFAFRNTLFIGDYFVTGVSDSKYFAYSSFASAAGYDMNTIQTKNSFKLNGEALTMAEYAATFENIDTVYIAFSAESISWMDCPTFVKKYTDFLDSIISAQPDADIYIQPILPINESQAQKRGYSVTNKKIEEINSYLPGIAEKRDVWYLDITAAFDEAEPSEETSGNGIRLNKDQYDIWYNYVITHRE